MTRRERWLRLKPHEQRASCFWDPVSRDRWYQEGYETGLTLYAGGTPDEIAYGLDHYRRRGQLRDGSYERGIADGIAAMVERGDDAPPGEWRRSCGSDRLTLQWRQAGTQPEPGVRPGRE